MLNPGRIRIRPDHNHGTSPIEDITYSYTIGDFSATGSVHVEQPVAGLGKSAVVEFPLGPIADCGEYPFTIKAGDKQRRGQQ